MNNIDFFREQCIVQCYIDENYYDKKKFLKYYNLKEYNSKYLASLFFYSHNISNFIKNHKGKKYIIFDDIYQIYNNSRYIQLCDKIFSINEMIKEWLTFNKIESELVFIPDVVLKKIYNNKKTIMTMGFWDMYAGMTYMSRFITDKYFLTNNDVNYHIDIIVTCSMINDNDFNYLCYKKKQGVQIYGIITEPVEHNSIKFYELLKNNFFDVIIGCIDNDNNRYKFPLYFSYFDYNNANIFCSVNKYVKECNVLDKKFCTLIASHDNGNTRTKIFKELSKIDKIDSPGKLLNNMSNEEINNVGNINFIKKYIFNLCPINHKCKLRGYIVEKIINCCLAGAIPIYFGEIDDIDKKIFNIDRIIIYDSFDERSIIETGLFIKYLYQNKEKLHDFYKKEVFLNTAYETCIEMEYNIKKIFL